MVIQEKNNIKLYRITNINDNRLEFIKTISSKYWDLIKFNQNIWYTKTISIYDLELPMHNHLNTWYMYNSIINLKHIYKVNSKYVYLFDIIVFP